jgi:hypothetical protein
MTYTATISGVTDGSGNVMASPFVWSFSTNPISTVTIPTVNRTSPASGATGVWSTTTVTATFNESVVGSSITTSDFVLTDPKNNTVSATVSYNDSTHTVTLRPSAPLTASTKYKVLISGVKDATGNVMSSPFTWFFTTAGSTFSSTSLIADSGFEQVHLGASNYAYNPSGSAWTFSSQSGIASNNSPFTAGNPSAPQGTQVAFLQRNGSISQHVTGWAAGSYVITFDAAQRENYQASQQNFNVLVDGTVVGSFTPSSTSYRSYSTAAFTVTAGAHTIAFQALDSAGGDNTAFVDQVAVVRTT